jgi:hypothetical protein
MSSLSLGKMPLDYGVRQIPSPGKTPSGLGEAIQAMKTARSAAARNLEITTLGEDAQMGEFGASGEPSGRGGFGVTSFQRIAHR